MKQALASVITNQAVAEGVYVIRLEEAEQAREVRPGQFVHVSCNGTMARSFDPLLRRPLSVLRSGAVRGGQSRQGLTSGQYEVLYDVVGRGTENLSRLRPGDIVDVLGPLGRPFQLDRGTRRLLLVSGGVGIVPLVALAEEAIQKGIACTLLAGFRRAGKAFPPERLPPELEYTVATDDGSLGYHGLVTALVPEHLDWADEIAACGPVPMLQALARLERPRSLPVQIAMEERMGCAMGVCLGCVVPTRHGRQRVCRDGPVFPIEDMGWTA